MPLTILLMVVLIPRSTVKRLLVLKAMMQLKTLHSFCPVTGTEKYERRTRLKERGICRSKNVASLRG